MKLTEYIKSGKYKETPKQPKRKCGRPKSDPALWKPTANTRPYQFRRKGILPQVEMHDLDRAFEMAGL